MAFVVVVSLPLILFVLIVAIACYLLGKGMGRRKTHLSQPYGPPAPPAQLPPQPQDKVPPQVRDFNFESDKTKGIRIIKRKKWKNYFG